MTFQVITHAAAVSIACSMLSAATFTGACDGSAIAIAGQGYFFSASDEDNVIRLYNLTAAGPPVAGFDLNAFLQPERTKKNRPKEVDIEAVAQVGKRFYWIGSHGRNKSGQVELSRHRLFATEAQGSGEGSVLVPVGVPYTRLMDDILNSGSSAAPVLRTADTLPHEKGGIDIEGLAATKAGALLVGFRSPLVDNKALIVPITNVQDVVGRGVRPQLGDDILLDLDGMGILDIAPTDEPDEFVVVAGAPGSHKGSAIYKWRFGQAPVKAYPLPPGGGSPDALLMDGDGFIHVARDMGDEGTPACKKLPEGQRSFTVEKLSRVGRDARQH